MPQIPKKLNAKVTQEALGLVEAGPILEFAAPIVNKMFQAMKLVSDDFEEEDPTETPDLNARFADAYYAAKDLFDEVRLFKVICHGNL